MWFKNLCIFQLSENFILSPAELEQKLGNLAFRPCGSHEQSSIGWASPMGLSSVQRVHSANGFMMICAQKQEKILPPAVVRELAQEKILLDESQQQRKLSKKERLAIKNELIFELLPKAFARSRKFYAYIDPKNSWLIVDSATIKNAEDMVSLLRKSLGSLPAKPLKTANNPAVVLTNWLANNQPADDIFIEDECELQSSEQESAIIRCKRHDLTLPEIINHLNSGKQVTKLALNWANRISFVIDENFAFKRLRFLDLIQDQISELALENDAERFDADFALMSLELSQAINRLLALFGGLSQN
jgi:recombination associated protein RdgC